MGVIDEMLAKLEAGRQKLNPVRCKFCNQWLSVCDYKCDGYGANTYRILSSETMYTYASTLANATTSMKSQYR